MHALEITLAHPRANTPTPNSHTRHARPDVECDGGSVRDDWLLIYGFLMGLLLRGLNHNCLVVAGHTRTGLIGRGLGGWVRAILIAFITILGIRHGGIFPDCYRVWWDSYLVEHSVLVWIGLTCTPTLEPPGRY